jgi:hypothetical protein
MTSGTALRITSCRTASIEEWDSVCRECDHATFFHTHWWASVFCNAKNDRMEKAAQVVAFSDGLSAVVPLTRKRFPGKLLSVYWSSPANTYGGWLSTLPLTMEHGRLLINHLLSFPDIVWRENPYNPYINALDIPRSVEDFTQVIDLKDGLDAAKARSDYSHRRAVRKAAESNVTIIEASNFESWISYFSLYQASRVRWRDKGLSRSREYSLDFFRSVYECPPANRVLWLALLDGAPIAGTLCFYWNRHAVSWSSAGRAEFFHRYRPNDLLYDRVIQHAAEHGYRWFDCNPSAGLRGVIDFKQHLGAQKMRSRFVNKRSFIHRCANVLRSVKHP